VRASGADHRQENVHVRGLPDDGLGAEGQLGLTGGDDDHGQRIQALIRSGQFQELKAIQHRHHQVQDDDGRKMTVTKLIERLLAVGRGHDAVAFHPERGRHRLAKLGIVFHQQDTARTFHADTVGTDLRFVSGLA
jgi:hypothetical protein